MNIPKQSEETRIGVFPEMPESEYRKSPALNKSNLVELDWSAAHYAHKMTTPPNPPTDAMQIGLIVEAMLFGTFDDPTKFVRAPGDAPKRPTAKQLNAKTVKPEVATAAAWWTDFDKASEGKIVVDGERLKQCDSVRASILRCDDAKMLLEGAKFQVPIFDVFTYGIPIHRKALVDCVPKEFPSLVDLKTTNDAKKEKFGKTALDLFYHVQAAWYFDIWKNCGGDSILEVKSWTFIVAEIEPPFCAVVYLLHNDDLERGRGVYMEWLRKYADAEHSGNWKGYDSPQTLRLPNWSKKEQPLRFA